MATTKIRNDWVGITGAIDRIRRIPNVDHKLVLIRRLAAVYAIPKGPVSQAYDQALRTAQMVKLGEVGAETLDAILKRFYRTAHDSYPEKSVLRAAERRHIKRDAGSPAEVIPRLHGLLDYLEKGAKPMLRTRTQPTKEQWDRLTNNLRRAASSFSYPSMREARYSLESAARKMLKLQYMVGDPRAEVKVQRVLARVVAYIQKARTEIG